MPMTMNRLIDRIRRRGNPCNQGAAWLGNRTDPQQAWDDCDNGHWIWWWLQCYYGQPDFPQDVPALSAVYAAVDASDVKDSRGLAQVIRGLYPYPPVPATTAEVIRYYVPCDEGRAYLEQYIDLRTAWEQCPNGYWMTWLMAATGAVACYTWCDHTWTELADASHKHVDIRLAEAIRIKFPYPPVINVHAKELQNEEGSA
jgi:hypothetical protein